MAPTCKSCSPPFRALKWLNFGQLFRGGGLSRSYPVNKNLKSKPWTSNGVLQALRPPVHQNRPNRCQIIQPVIGLIRGLLYFHEQPSNYQRSQRLQSAEDSHPRFLFNQQMKGGTKTRTKRQLQIVMEPIFHLSGALAAVCWTDVLQSRLEELPCCLNPRCSVVHSLIISGGGEEEVEDEPRAR